MGTKRCNKKYYWQTSNCKLLLNIAFRSITKGRRAITRALVFSKVHVPFLTKLFGCFAMIRRINLRTWSTIIDFNAIISNVSWIFSRYRSGHFLIRLYWHLRSLDSTITQLFVVVTRRHLERQFGMKLWELAAVLGTLIKAAVTDLLNSMVITTTPFSCEIQFLRVLFWAVRSRFFYLAGFLHSSFLLVSFRLSFCILIKRFYSLIWFIILWFLLIRVLIAE